MLRLLVALAVSVGGAGAAPRAFTIDDALAIKAVTDPRISPDGQWVAFVVEKNDLDRDEKTSRIYMTSIDGRTSLAMTGETYSATDPRWSPDGRYLSFIAVRDDLEANAAAQVFTLDLRGGDAEAYTDVPQGVEAHDWAPTGDKLLLAIRDESASAKAARLALASGGDEPAAAVVIDRLQFKEDGVGYLDRSRQHYHVQEGRLGERKQLTFGDYDDTEAVWSPDATRIAFTSNRTDEPDSNVNSDIWIADLARAGKPFAPRRVTDNPGTDGTPSWSPDGTEIAYSTQLDPKLFWYAAAHIAVAPAGGGAARILTQAFDRFFYQPKFSPDGREIFALYEHDGEQPLVAIDAKSGAKRDIIAGEVGVYGFDAHASGAIAAQMGRATLPDEIFVSSGPALTQISRVNEAALQGVKLSAPFTATFKSRDGTPVEAFFYPPTSGRAKKAPTILRIHGGPTSQFDFTFDAYAQLYAANGYAVVMPNPRGSTGYGTDFASAIYADWGNKDFDDVMAGVDHAIAIGLSDPKRLGVGGWSYGGILTNYVITKTDRFDAAVTGASEFNYLANYGHDIYQREYEIELGLPWDKENREVWEKLNIFSAVDKVTTPTLVIGGAEDWNVPILNSEQIYQILKRRGVPTGLIVYPGEDHSIDRPSFYKDRFERYLGWYKKYVRS
ncbi:MAG: S9 family peptidase [Parvularculaceae bacterium]|nr:S9 family peptidase [Parvularculaceae bacterium]